MSRDLTKVLSDAEMVKMRHLLSTTPDVPLTEQEFAEYPKMLFAPSKAETATQAAVLGFLDYYKLVKSHPDPLVVKDAQEKLRAMVVTVVNFEEEEEFLADGWKCQPAELYIALGEDDPRVPKGREARLASRQGAQDRELELRAIRRRYAELTGKRLADEPEPVAAPTPEPVRAPMAAGAPTNGVARPTQKPKLQPIASRRH